MGDVSTGLWFDHSQGTVLGWEITLPVSQGNLLLSALTFLVTIAGTGAWGIVAALTHSLIVRRRHEPDVVDLQHQVALRNSAGALNTILDSIKIHRAWSKNKTKRLWTRTLSLFLPAITIWAAFAAASLLVSRVASRGYNSVLVRSAENNCGMILLARDPIADQGTQLNKMVNDTAQARNYATDFYMDTANTRTARSIFPVARLPITVDTNADCPAINQTLCYLGHDSAISMVTEVIDSHKMLGINAQPSDRVTARIRTTCAVINVADYAYENDTAINFYIGTAPGLQPTYTYFKHTFLDNVGYQIR